MTDQRRMRGQFFRFAKEEPSEPDQRACANESLADGKGRASRRGVPWSWVSLVFLTLLLVMTTALALQAFHLVNSLRAEMQIMSQQTEQRMQRLDASLGYASKRQRLLLGMRDEIMRVNPRVSLADAYQYAQLILSASEKYPALDPLMFLAIGTVESGFDSRATSRANARGLYQIWPATGRMLARALDWEYTDEMLYDPEKNTEMAALYLDILFTAYHDESLVLAEYNGGPLNAGYLRAGSQRAAAETRQYVLKVLDVFEGLNRTIELGEPDQLELMHIDRARNGKRLIAWPVSQMTSAE